MTVSSAIAALVLCWGFGAGAKKLINYQPFPQILTDFVHAVSVPPGRRCEGNADADAIIAGASGCVLGALSRVDSPDILVVGDSHAVMWTEALDTLGKEHQRAITLMGYSSCTPLVDYVAPTRKECVAIFKNVIKYIIHSPIKTVVLAGYWLNAMHSINSIPKNNDAFTDFLEKTIILLQQHGKQVVIVRDIPEMSSDQYLREKILQGLRNPRETITAATLGMHEQHQRPVNEVITAMSEKYALDVIDPAAYICPDRRCLVVEGGVTLYQDRHHLTDAAARKFRQIFEPLFLMPIENCE